LERCIWKLRLGFLFRLERCIWKIRLRFLFELKGCMQHARERAWPASLGVGLSILYLVEEEMEFDSEEK